MIDFDEAVAQIRTVAKPLGSERVALADAASRVLAASVVAQIDSPRSDVSAMDGYAVREEDLGGGPLNIVGESLAGSGWPGKLGPNECARIFTGAPVPAGADRVIMQEDVRREGDAAMFTGTLGAARHIRARGSDFSAGEELLTVGTLLGPRAIVAAAAADVDHVAVHRRPRLRIVSTGDELAEPGSAAPHPAAVPDSVSLGVAALARFWGAKCLGQMRLRDDLGAMEVAASEALQDADVVVVTGGASVGERDFAKAMFAPLGLALLFAKVAIRPGKPAWFGRAGETLVLGLPGNPTSAMVTARLLLAPLLAGLSGQAIEAALRWRSVPLAEALMACGERETFHRARWRDGHVEILPFQESHAQKALARADLLVRQRAFAPGQAANSLVEILDF